MELTPSQLAALSKEIHRRYDQTELEDFQDCMSRALCSSIAHDGMTTANVFLAQLLDAVYRPSCYNSDA